MPDFPPPPPLEPLDAGPSLLPPPPPLDTGIGVSDMPPPPAAPWVSAGEEPGKEVESAPWWYGAIEFGASLLDPFKFTGDLTRAAIYDLALRKPGEESELARMFTVKNLLTYAPGGAAPEMVAPGEEIAHRLGFTSGAAGFVLDVALDPLVIVDIWGTVGARGAAKAATKLAGEALPEYVAKKGIKRLVTASDIRAAAEELKTIGNEPLADVMEGYARSVEKYRKIRSPSEWVPDNIKVATNKALMAVLDTIPFPGGLRVAEGGKTARAPLSMAEALFMPGTKERVQGGIGARLSEALHGSPKILEAEDVGRSEGIYDTAQRLGEEYRHAASVLIADMRNAFKDIAGKNVAEGWEEFNTWGKVLGDTLDDLIGNPAFTKEVLNTGKLPDVAEVLETSIGYQKAKDRLYLFAKKYGYDFDDVWKASVDTLKKNMQFTWAVGYKLSRYDEFRSFIGSFAKQEGMHPTEITDMLWRKAFDFELADEELATLEMFQQEWVKTPSSQLASVDPFEYVKNISQGYIRKLYGVDFADTGTLKRLITGIQGGSRIYSAEELEALDVIEAMQRVAGEEHATKLAEAMTLLGDGPISTRHLAQVSGVSEDAIIEAVAHTKWGAVGNELFKRLNAVHPDMVAAKAYAREYLVNLGYELGAGTTTVEDVAKRLGMKPEHITELVESARAADPLNKEMVENLMEALSDPLGGPTSPRWGMYGKGVFKERKVTGRAADALMPMTTLEQRMAAFGEAAARSITAQEGLARSYKVLDELNLIAEKISSVDMVDPSTGLKYARVPDSQIFGPLAGKYIPKMFYDTIAEAAFTGDAGPLATFANTVRAMWLTAPSTIVDNTVSGVIMMMHADVPPKDIAKYAGRALQVGSKIQKGFNVRELGPGAEYLKLYGEGRLSTQARDAYGEFLGDILQHVGDDVNAVKHRQALWRKKLAKLAKGEPLYGMFQISEDTMRLISFFSKRERLLERGFEEAEAGKLAAIYANNIVFDYSKQSYALRRLRDSGLALFPAFQYFNIGRTWQLAAKRPSILSVTARTPSASLPLAVRDPEERKRASYAMYRSWLNQDAPILLPGKKPNEFWAMPMAQILPPVAAIGSDEAFLEPLGGGILRPLLDASSAWAAGNGKGAFSQRYGRSVFNQYATMPQRLAQTAWYVARSYAPGYIRSAEDLASNMTKRWQASNPDAFFEAYGDEYGRGPSEALMKAAGFKVYKQGPGTYVEAVQGSLYDYENKARELMKEIRKAAAAGDKSRAERLKRQFEQLVEREKERFEYEFGR